jgi:hypothetical protein
MFSRSKEGAFYGANEENKGKTTISPSFSWFPSVQKPFLFGRTQLDGIAQVDLFSPARWMAEPMARPNNFSAINGKVCL